MENPLGVSAGKGNQGTTQGGKNSLTSRFPLKSLSETHVPLFVYSATRHNINMYPHIHFAAIHHLYRPRLSLSDLGAER